MKKQNLLAIIGTLAIMANLIIPGLAFAETQGQLGTQVIDCGTLTLHVHGSGAPDIDFSMDALNVSTGTQYSYGDLIGGTQYQNTTDILPIQAFIYVNDQRTTGEGCNTGGENFLLNVSAQAGGFSNGSATIPNANLKVATTTNVTPWSLDDAITWHEYGEDGVISNFIGNTQLVDSSDVEVSHPVADAADLTDYNSFSGGDLGTNDVTTLMESIHNVVGQAGIGIAWNLTVDPNQQAGTYTNTITYDLSPKPIP